MLLERHVGKQKMVVDHHDIRLGRPAARLDDMATVVPRALRSEAIFRRGGDGLPDRVVFGKVSHLREIAVHGAGGPSRETHHPRHHLPRDEPSGGQHLLVAPAAEVVRAALEQGNPRSASEGTAHERQIAFEQSLLEMAGTGRDHDPAAAGDGGNEVRERLAGARPRFTDEEAPLQDGTFDRRGHGSLRRAWCVAGQELRQRTGHGKDAVASGRGAHLPRPAMAGARPTAGNRFKRRLARGHPRATPSTRPRTSAFHRPGT